MFVACTTAALLVLAGWQLQREWLIRDCLDGGVLGRQNCGPLKVRPILQRDLRRS